MTNGFSRKIEKHVAAISLHFMYYSFACVAGVRSELGLWPIPDIAIAAVATSLCGGFALFESVVKGSAVNPEQSD